MNPCYPPVGAIHDTKRSGEPQSAMKSRDAKRSGEPRSVTEQEKKFGGKILVVDDEEGVRSVVKTYLEYLDLTIKTASDGVEALKLVERESFDVILTDVLMPHMDGLTLIDEVRKVQPDIEIVIMTGYASVNTAVEAVKKNVFDYIIKPFKNMQAVYNTLYRAIERKRMIQERKTLIDDLKRTNDELTYNRGLLAEKNQAN